MNPDLPFSVTFRCEAINEAAFTEAAIAHLRLHGFSVCAPNSISETPGEFCRRVGLSTGYFRRVLRHPAAPHVLTVRGFSGRVLTIQSTAAFDAFCRRNKK